MIQVSEGRWMSEPEAMYQRKNGTWVARMPSGEEEDLLYAEYWALISAFGVLGDE